MIDTENAVKSVQSRKTYAIPLRQTAQKAMTRKIITIMTPAMKKIENQIISFKFVKVKNG
jgi:hypothetical protein